jgi:hypothetical protein
MKRRYSRGWYLLLLAVLVVGCGGMAVAPTSEAEWNSGLPAAPAASEPAAEPVADVDKGYAVDAALSYDLPRMIIYDGSLVLVLADTEAGQDAVVAIAEGASGYVSSASSYSYEGGLRRIDMTLRVPAEAFFSTMEALRALAIEVTQDAISSQDVTQEYVDLESRLKALEVKEARLEQLMEEAEDTEAVLAVYAELSATQVQIEETKGRMRFLERQSAMATITVTLVPDELSRPVEIAGWRPQGTAKRAVETLVGAFQFLVEALIWIVILVLPVVILIGFAIIGFIRLLRLIFGRGKRRKKGAAEAAELAGREEPKA